MTKYIDLQGQQFGEYRLIRWLGGGRYSDVYLSQHIRSQVQVVVKVFNTYLTQERDQRSFLNEIREMRLEHPHIMPLLDTGIATNDLPFLVMKYVPHGTLRKKYTRGLQLPFSTVLGNVAPIASALQHAHNLNLVHGNIKPENMLIGDEDTILLSDFTITAVTHKTVPSVMQNDMQKSVSYLAPEQSLGKADAASDQYALGIVVYEWLSGRHPFQGATTEITRQHNTATPPSLCKQVPHLTDEIEQVILRALAHDPGKRFASVQEFATALEAASYPEQPPTAPMPTITLTTKGIATHEVNTQTQTIKQENPIQQTDTSTVPLEQSDHAPEQYTPTSTYPVSHTETAVTSLETLPSTPTMTHTEYGQKRYILAVAAVAFALLVIASSIFIRPISNAQVAATPVATQWDHPGNVETTTAKNLPNGGPSPVASPTPTQKPTERPATYPTPTPTLKPAPTSKPTPTPKPTCPPQIQSGSTGPWVETLQKELNARGMKGQDGKPLEVDGEFGSNTEYAVKSWQTKKHIEVDGQVGPITWHTLGNC